MSTHKGGVSPAVVSSDDDDDDDDDDDNDDDNGRPTRFETSNGISELKRSMGSLKSCWSVGITAMFAAEAPPKKLVHGRSGHGDKSKVSNIHYNYHASKSMGGRGESVGPAALCGTSLVTENDEEKEDSGGDKGRVAAPRGRGSPRLMTSNGISELKRSMVKKRKAEEDWPQYSPEGPQYSQGPHYPIIKRVRFEYIPNTPVKDWT